MPAVFTGRWTRGTILDQALKRVGNVKIRALARSRLNRLLEEVYSKWEWPFLYKSYDFTFPAGNQGGTLTQWASFALPSDFLKTESETTGIRILTRDGNPSGRPVVEISPLEFRRRAYPADAEAAVPQVFYCSLAERIAYFWPRPLDSCAAQLLYKFLPPDMDESDPDAYDLDVPLFPWGGFLSKEMEVWANTYDKDWTAAQAASAESASMFEMIRGIALPRDSQEPTLPLDPRVFGPGFRDEASTGWRWGDEDEW